MSDEGSTSESDRERSRDEVGEANRYRVEEHPIVMASNSGSGGYTNTPSLPLPSFSTLPHPHGAHISMQGHQEGFYRMPESLHPFARSNGVTHTAPPLHQFTPQSAYNNIDSSNRKRSFVNSEQDGSDGPLESVATNGGVQSLTREDQSQKQVGAGVGVGNAQRIYRSDDGEGSPGSNARGGIRSDDGRARLTSEDRINRQRELNRFHSKLSRKRKKEKEQKLLNDVMRQIYFSAHVSLFLSVYAGETGLCIRSCHLRSFFVS